MAKNFVKTHPFVEEIAKGVHNLDTSGAGGDQLKVALTNTDPGTACEKYADLTTPLSDGLFDGANPFNVTVNSSEQTTGEYKLVVADLTLEATSEAGPFRYVVLYNDGATNDEVIGYYDYESSITLNPGDTFKIDWSQTDGVLTIE